MAAQLYESLRVDKPDLDASIERGELGEVRSDEAGARRLVEMLRARDIVLPEELVDALDADPELAEAFIEGVRLQGGHVVENLVAVLDHALHHQHQRGLAAAEQIQIRAVQNKDAGHADVLLGGFPAAGLLGHGCKFAANNGKLSSPAILLAEP